MVKYRLVRRQDLSVGTAKKDGITIPIGGGRTTVTLNAADFGFESYISLILYINVIREEPVVDDVYREEVSSITPDKNSVDITVATGTGTTLSLEVNALGE